MKIKLILLDIDGVLTDGKVTIDSKGNEYKTIDFKDIDAVFEFKCLGYKVGLITGEGTRITQYFKERFKPDFFYNACKDKPKAMKDILEKTGYSTEQVCYMGDGKHDIPIMKLIDFTACPANAIPEVKEIVKIKLQANGGDGCIWELLKYLEQGK